MAASTHDLAARAREVMHQCDTDLEAFFGHFAEDCSFVWGNDDAVVGPAAIQRAVVGRLTGVSALRHEIHETWADDESAVLRMDVVYDLENGRTAGTPAVTVMRFRDDRIVEYLIYQDPAPLLAAQAG